MMSRFSPGHFARSLLPASACWAVALLAALPAARAQWVSENYTAPAGWSAIWVPLDLSHTSIDEALAGKNDIQEIWRWNPPSGPQFVTNPSTPVQTSPNWSVWRRGLPNQSTLFAFTGNAAYLVKVRDGAAAVSFALKGRPIRPDYPWSTTGVNLVGFATPASAPTFTQFFSLGGFTTEPTVLSYVGGALSATAPKNPIQILNSETVARGKAYWVQATQFTNYYGPIAVEISERSGLHYGRSRVALTLRLRNTTSGNQARAITVTLTPQASETPPAIVAGTAVMGSGTTAGRVASIVPDLNNGVVYAAPPTVTIDAPSAGTTATATAQLNAAGRITGFTVTNAGAGYGSVTPVVRVTPAIAGATPLKIRGAYNPTTGEFAYSAFSAATTIELAAGAATDVVLVVDRGAMTAAAGSVYGSLIRVSDSVGYTSLHIPVSAVSSDLSGLWTGAAVINEVSQVVGSRQIVMTPATGVATVANGAVASVQLVTQGDSYVSEPTVTLTGGGGTGATAIAKLDYGVVSALQLVQGGSGYTSAPTVVITGGQSNPNGTAGQFPLKLILHRTAAGQTRLLQQVYIGNSATATVAATAESLFPTGVKPVSRLSSSHFPTDFSQLGTGALGATGTVSFEVLLDYDSDSNPFVHRYHPDHDNLDARFESKLPAGRESWTVRRAITLEFQSSLPGVSDPAWGVNMIGGKYTETVTGLRATAITSRGSFVLYRVADATTILTP